MTGGGDNSVKVWREEGDSWTMEDKLEGHTDWVRDVAWAPSIGLPVSRIASCSQVFLTYQLIHVLYTGYCRIVQLLCGLKMSLVEGNGPLK